jgi:hypothetical protein
VVVGSLDPEASVPIRELFRTTMTLAPDPGGASAKTEVRISAIAGATVVQGQRST